MQAMVYRGPYKIRVEEKDTPPIEHPNDAIVRVTMGAICGSDLHLYHGMIPDTRVGHTFDHAFIGVVEEVGSSVQNLQLGDRVIVPFNVFCGSCFSCARGLYSNCHNVNPDAWPTSRSIPSSSPAPGSLAVSPPTPASSAFGKAWGGAPISRG